MPFLVEAQDVHFSQFFNAPLTVSPSNTGNFDGDWRVMGNYRQQWKRIDQTPYLTQSIAFDKQFYHYTEQFSYGAIIINDKSAGSLKVLKAMLSAGYHKRLNKHFFHGGIQAGYVSKSWLPEQESYPNQFNWETGEFDPTLPSYESGFSGRLGYLDLNVGGGYNIKLKKVNPFISIAFYHVNYPKETFYSNVERLKLRQVYNIGAKIELKKNWFVEPQFLVMNTNSANEMLMGTNVLYKLQPNSPKAAEAYAGIFYRDGFNRNNDAYFLTVGLKFKNYLLGISYDRNISDLYIATNYKGAFELSFIYTSLKTRLSKTEIPCDRF